MMRFEWDPRKNASNKHKHGISFDQAITAFDDPFALIELDKDHSTAHEIRELLIGESHTGVLIVIFTIREEGSIYRIISARRANKREHRLYEEAKRIPL